MKYGIFGIATTYAMEVIKNSGLVAALFSKKVLILSTMSF
jgi:hypothetical protein